jgi:excisionase family DNA binding protein
MAHPTGGPLATYTTSRDANLADHYGPFMRVEEAARMLRISRTSAYALASQWIDSDGVQGLPAVRIGRSVRIPTAVLEQLARAENQRPGRLRDAS